MSLPSRSPIFTSTSKRSLVAFPFRALSAGAQPKLPECRAWRIIARRAADFAAAVPAVAAGVVPMAPAGALDGIYPLWVRSTGPGGEPGALLLVDGDGWNLSPVGPNWTIEQVGVAGTASDVLCYVVEVVQDIDECGQVNGGASAPAGAGAGETVIVAGSNGQNIQTTPIDLVFMRPQGARLFDLLYDARGLTVGGSTSQLFCYETDSSGVERPANTNAMNLACSGIVTLLHAVRIGAPLQGSPQGLFNGTALIGYAGVSPGPKLRFRWTSTGNLTFTGGAPVTFIGRWS